MNLQLQQAPTTRGYGQGIWATAWGKEYAKGTIDVGRSTYEYYKRGPLDVFNSTLLDVILIRQEYRLAHDSLQRVAQRRSPLGRVARFIITGQPGIGKTVFLIYLLIERLQRKQPTALQTGNAEFLLFDKDGVRQFSTTARNHQEIPPDAWALSACIDPIDAYKPCEAFLESKAFVVHATSPRSSNWKHWKKQSSARIYVMDVWPKGEMEALLSLLKLDVSDGIRLARKWGPCTKTVLDILSNTMTEERHIREVAAAASDIAQDVVQSFRAIELLDFSGPNVALSSIFFVRPIYSGRDSSVVFIPTLDIAKVFSQALIYASHATQNMVLTRMSRHASLRTAADWIFENFMHARLSASSKPIQAFDCNGVSHELPSASSIHPVFSESLSSTVLPFYWRPSASEVPGIDAVICDHNGVYALQASTTSTPKHADASTGLQKIYDGLHPTMRQKPMHLVFVSPSSETANVILKRCTLANQWNHVEVWACELVIGAEYEAALLDVMNGARDVFATGDWVDDTPTSNGV
ncbi:hypothetical protein Hypma_016026 [Hypsizygus marmoreus]|uniref:Uncharacterized protein n=1 Tax=Hypsizygus marmoreus TaxID=39966 RepID=A0A369KBJ0_HYPMA|nr:hypothetical protein Hypma_016026 [Hypsizygus marmoreus]